MGFFPLRKFPRYGSFLLRAFSFTEVSPSPLREFPVTGLAFSCYGLFSVAGLSRYRLSPLRAFPVAGFPRYGFFPVTGFSPFWAFFRYGLFPVTGFSRCGLLPFMGCFPLRAFSRYGLFS